MNDKPTRRRSTLVPLGRQDVRSDVRGLRESAPQSPAATAPGRRQSSRTDALHLTSVFEIAHLLGLTSGADPASDWSAEQRQSCLDGQDSALGDLLQLDDHRVQHGVIEDPAVEEEAHTAWTARSRVQEVHAHKPASGDIEAALLLGFAPTSLPRRLADLDSTAWNRPTAFVGRLQDQQPALAATYERTGGSGDGRNESRQIRSFTSVTVAHEITLGGSRRQRLRRESCNHQRRCGRSTSLSSGSVGPG